MSELSRGELCSDFPLLGKSNLRAEQRRSSALTFPFICLVLKLYSDFAL
jgi:hypothetical protein